jgi:hypothetical protein
MSRNCIQIFVRARAGEASIQRMRNLPILILMTATLAACTSAAATPAPASSELAQTEAAAMPVFQQDQTHSPEIEAPPVATSRGPALVATDPSTVSLASGTLQLIEFFRFT